MKLGAASGGNVHQLYTDHARHPLPLTVSVSTLAQGGIIIAAEQDVLTEHDSDADETHASVDELLKIIGV